MSNTAEIKALLVSRDSEMVSTFSELFREIGVTTQNYRQESNAALGLGTIRFEAVVLDFDKMTKTSQVIEALRESQSSKNALVFAVASEGEARQRALEQGANFAFERPFKKSQIKQVLHTAYSLMLRERRRYYRHAVCVPVRLQRTSGVQIECSSINISNHGMAVSVPCELELGEVLEINFSLPGSGFAVTARGTAVWDDKHGKAGLSLHCDSLEIHNRLASWLDRSFYRQLSSAYA